MIAQPHIRLAGAPVLRGSYSSSQIPLRRSSSKLVVRPKQATALSQAISQGCLHIESLIRLPALELYAQFRRTLGNAESACLALAVTNNWALASDDKGALRRAALARVGKYRLLGIAEILLRALRADVLSLEEADTAIAISASHRFHLSFPSFADLLRQQAKAAHQDTK